MLIFGQKGPSMAQKWAKMAIFGINFNLKKNYQFVQNLAFFILLVLDQILWGIIYIISVSMEFCAKNDSHIGIG